MTRPKPKVLLSVSNEKTNKVEEVLEADCVYAVFYKGKPINLRIKSEFVDHSQSKYRKSSFQNEGHALHLAKKLNKKYDTNEFYVVKLQNGEIL